LSYEGSEEHAAKADKRTDMDRQPSRRIMFCLLLTHQFPIELACRRRLRD
jgi:hypothetical protein